MCLSLALDRPNDVLSEGYHKGFKYVTMRSPMNVRCGYVRVPSNHPWSDKDYDELNIECHGGLTFAAFDTPCGDPEEESNPSYWVGFDCGHYMDSPDPSFGGNPFFYEVPGALGTIRTQDFVEDECRKICDQAAAA